MAMRSLVQTVYAQYTGFALARWHTTALISFYPTFSQIPSAGERGMSDNDD